MKRKEKTERTRAKILAAAIREFEENGYTGGTVNHICESGINKGLIYHNYKDKDEIYLACLRDCCDSLTAYMETQDCGTDVLKYMDARARWRSENPDKAHIFFEALLSPQKELQAAIKDCMRGFRQMNLEMCRGFIASVRLRDGVSEQAALSYFCWMQEMFNAYFSGPAMEGIGLDEKITAHEGRVQEFFDLMLYGIAEGDGKS